MLMPLKACFLVCLFVLLTRPCIVHVLHFGIVWCVCKMVVLIHLRNLVKCSYAVFESFQVIFARYQKNYIIIYSIVY